MVVKGRIWTSNCCMSCPCSCNWLFCTLFLLWVFCIFDSSLVALFISTIPIVIDNMHISNLKYIYCMLSCVVLINPHNFWNDSWEVFWRLAHNLRCFGYYSALCFNLQNLGCLFWITTCCLLWVPFFWNSSSILENSQCFNALMHAF